MQKVVVGQLMLSSLPTLAVPVDAVPVDAVPVDAVPVDADTVVADAPNKQAVNKTGAARAITRVAMDWRVVLGIFKGRFWQGTGSVKSCIGGAPSSHRSCRAST
jgi:hypothetical protein